MCELTFEQRQDFWAGLFEAMACPCEVLVDAADRDLIQRLARIACDEARRIEHKFSRYRPDNIIHTINNSHGRPVRVDEETARLLDYAAECHRLSAGKFDITSGVLRAAWRFDGSDRLPTPQQVSELLTRVGWDKVQWHTPVIQLQPGMEIDLGGIGKEYAVDRIAQLLRAATRHSFVVNLGGDLYVSGRRADGNTWIIGIDDPAATGEKSIGEISIAQGGVATSGDARRFLLRDGVRYGHILDPRNGWPVPDAPRSVTVIAPTCTEAGMYSTFAMLEGAGARAFLDAQGVTYWCV